MTKIVHCKKEKYDVYIGRPSKWGNPYSHIFGKGIPVKNREEAIQRYKDFITEGAGCHLLRDLHELKDKILGCWCPPLPCHGDVLIELIESGKYC
jgi:hypothetical protein